MFSIAIDGPSGAGKSTISKNLAQKLGYIYVDTGALYRAIGYTALMTNVDVDDADMVEGMLKDISIKLEYFDGNQHVFVNTEDVTSKIRQETVSMAASAVSAHKVTRTFLLDLQRDFAKTSNVIMDGRDIGTVVLPDADIKIFLTASAEQRALRRQKELIGKGVKAVYSDILRDLKERDYNDIHREIAPLKAAEDAITIDTTTMTFDEVAKKVYSLVKEKKNI